MEAHNVLNLLSDTLRPSQDCPLAHRVAPVASSGYAFRNLLVFSAYTYDTDVLNVPKGQSMVHRKLQLHVRCRIPIGGGASSHLFAHLQFVAAEESEHTLDTAGCRRVLSGTAAQEEPAVSQIVTDAAAHASAAALQQPAPGMPAHHMTRGFNNPWPTWKVRRWSHRQHRCRRILLAACTPCCMASGVF